MDTRASETNTPDVLTTHNPYQSNRSAGVLVVQIEGGEVAEPLPSLQQFIRNVQQSDGFLSVGDSEKLSKILEGMKPEDVNAKDENDGGQTALHHVARLGLKGVIVHLLKHGAIISAEDANKNQPLHLSCQGGFVGTTTELLDQGAKKFINAKNSSGQTALHLACRGGKGDIVKVLLKYKAKTNVLTTSNRSPIFDASRHGNLAIVQDLLCHKSWDKTLLGKKSKGRGRTPLHVAIYKGHVEIAEKLLESGSKLDICDSQEHTPLMLATKRENVRLMTVLLQTPSERQDGQLEKPDKEKLTPLRVAASQGFLIGVDLLIKAGAANYTSQDLEIQKLLSAYEEFIKDDSNRTALGSQTLALLLRTASRWRYAKIVEYLLTFSDIRNCNTPNDNGWSGLAYASFYGHAKIVNLFLKNETNLGLSKEEKWQALHAASKQGYHNIVKQLLDKNLKTPIDLLDQDGMTVLHHAILGDIHNVEKQDEELLGPNSVDVDEENHSGSEPAKHDDVAKLLLDAEAKPGQKTKEGETALHLAVRSPIYKRTDRVELILEHMEHEDIWAANNEGQTALGVAFEVANTENQAVNWAVEKGDRHNLARSILLKRKGRPEHGMENINSEGWSLIELAAYHALPEVLALLLVNSTSRKETMKRIDSAKELVAKKMSQKKELSTRAKPRVATSSSMPAGTSEPNDDDSEDDQDDDDNEPNGDQNAFNAEDYSGDFAKEHLVMDMLNDPQIVIIKDSESYEIPQPERGVEGVPKDHSASIFRFYADKEELSIVQRFRTVQKVIYDEGPKQIMKEAVDNLQAIYKNMKSRPQIANPKNETKSQFTWVHLSSTNMVWMEDALKRILKDEGISKERFQMINSFFQDSWAEIPDNTSPSRFMRPQHSYNAFQTEKTTNDQDGRYTALYIPYLSFARYCRGQCSDHSESVGDDKLHEKTKRQKLHDEARRCQGLLKAYQNRVIHGPSTLDEWYYHFSAERSSSDDKQRRNETQVVTKSLDDKTSEGDHWRLVRINQLWAWVVGDKWLITATWDPIDGIEETLSQGIIDHIRKQAKIRGKRYQPYSPFYMSKLLVDYCIGSYERARIPTDKEHEQHVSIRQIFSNYINTIGRDETALFERFSKFSLKTSDRQGLKHLLLDDEIRKATEEAKRMSCEIKDIRDELNILKSVAQYQRDVEQKLVTNSSSNMGSRNTNLRANYVVDDVSQMDRVSLRIQSSISETLSLQQSEIANLQATLSVEQGKTLMAFTIVTIVFLPLSFLATFFAMDTESFQKSAWWAKLAVFLLSFGLFILFPFIFKPISQLTTYMLNKDKRSKKLPAGATGNRSTDPKDKPIDSGFNTASDVEKAGPPKASEKVIN